MAKKNQSKSSSTKQAFSQVRIPKIIIQAAENLISTVRARYNVPDFSSLEDKELIILLCLNYVWGHQCIMKIGDFDSPDEEVFRGAELISYNPSPDRLVLLSAFCDNREPLEFLVWLRLQKIAVAGELHKRLKRHRWGYTMLGLDAGKGPRDISKLLKPLRLEKISSYRPVKESGEDLQGIALMAALEYHRNLPCRVRVKLPKTTFVPLPQIPGLPVEDPPWWNQFYSDYLAELMDRFARGVVPTLKDEEEKVRERVHQTLRDHWEGWEAQKRTGEEVSFEEFKQQAEEPPNIKRSEGVWKADEERREKLVEMGLFQTEEREMENVTSNRLFKVLQEAKKYKRWGNKAVKAFNYYCDGYTEEEASQRAGIDQRSFRNYISRLNKIFTSKK